MCTYVGMQCYLERSPWHVRKMNPEYTLLTLKSTCLFTPPCVLQEVWAVTNTELTEVIRPLGFSSREE